LLRHTGLDTAIREAASGGLPVWGTCAGAILMARDVEHESAVLGLVDIGIRRNAYGSQLDSFVTRASVAEVAETPLPLVFIRAPLITRVGPGVRVLLKVQDQVVAVAGDRTLVTTFHPELTPDLGFHRFFLAMVRALPRFRCRPCCPAGSPPCPLT
jgi:5'-phosphate synthase pdxT subunit